MTFPNAWFASQDDIGMRLQEVSSFEALNLKLQLRRKLRKMQRTKRFFLGKARSTQQWGDTPLCTQFVLVLAQLQQIGFMREIHVGRFEGQVSKYCSHTPQIETH